MVPSSVLEPREWILNYLAIGRAAVNPRCCCACSTCWPNELFVEEYPAELHVESFFVGKYLRPSDSPRCRAQTLQFNQNLERNSQSICPVSLWLNTLTEPIAGTFK